MQKRQKKILCLIDNLGPGGAQRQMVSIAKLFKQSGFDVSFIIYGKNDFFRKELESNKIHIHSCVTSNYLLRIFEIRNYIRNGHFDVVISFLDNPDFLNCISAIGGKKWKIITSERSAMESKFISRRNKIFALARRISDNIVCNSYNAMAMWEKYYPNYKEKLHVIYNTVLLPDINSKYIPKKNGKLNIVVAASYRYLKNPIGLVQALCLLCQEERSKININWYGKREASNDGTNPYDKALKLIIENNLQNIQLNEETKDITSIMNEADIIALFSKFEGLPNAICEGMALGKPIIMTRVSDCEVLIDETNGFLCDWDNPQSIKETLIEAINLSECELINMGKKSKEKADKLFSEKIILSQWCDLIS